MPQVVDDELWRRQRDDGSQMIEVAIPGHPKCHFFEPASIEFDIDPAEITDRQSCDIILAFVRDLGRFTGRPVHITPEDRHHLHLITYDVAADRFIEGGASPDDC